MAAAAFPAETVASALSPRLPAFDEKQSANVHHWAATGSWRHEHDPLPYLLKERREQAVDTRRASPRDPEAPEVHLRLGVSNGAAQLANCEMEEPLGGLRTRW
jgi:hypothetical protein